MIITTKYDVGDSVWIWSSRSGQIEERQIKGVRIQSVPCKRTIAYSFVKDNVLGDYLKLSANVDFKKNFFWILESQCFSNKEDLVEHLNKEINK